MLLGMLGLLGLIICLVLFVVRAVQRKPKKPFGVGMLLCLVVFTVGVAMDSGPRKSEAIQLEEPVQETKLSMDALLDTIEADMDDAYDGHTITHDTDKLTVNVWRNSITETADTILAGSSDPKDEDWTWLKTETEDTVRNICNTIKKSDSPSLSLELNVLDDTDHSRTLLTFTNSGISYDIVADTPVKEEEPPAETPAAPEETKPEAPEAPASPSAPSDPVTPPSAPETAPVQSAGIEYVLNTNTMKFHLPGCRDVNRISAQNRASFTGTRDQLLAKQYDPCGHCNP